MKARTAYARGDTVKIEHVSPVRDFTRRAIDKIDELDDDGLAKSGNCCSARGRCPGAPSKYGRHRAASLRAGRSGSNL
jgi:hypothetical protein